MIAYQRINEEGNLRYKIHIKNNFDEGHVLGSSMILNGYVYLPLFWCFYKHIQWDYVYVTGTVDEAISELTAKLLIVALNHQKKYKANQELKRTMKRAKVNNTNNTLLKGWKLL